MKKMILLLSLGAATAFAEIKPEKFSVVEELPATWPPHWIIAQDGAFFHMNDGKFIVLDADADDPVHAFKGMFNGSFIAQFHQARTKPEMYVVETFHSRGHRGERTDVLTIYDKRTLAPIGEVLIPPKRSSNMPTDFNLQLVDEETIALVYNFTPATSVSVVDVVAREFLGEIPLPGCSLVYPMSGRAFASLCSDGSMFSVRLGDDGQQVATHRTEPFFDVDADPLMEKAAIHGGVAHFPTFLGNLYPIDLNGATPVVGRPWSLIGDEEGGWRPGGIRVATTDSSGRLYVLMHPGGGDGTHKDPGIEVWVFDLEKKERIGRIELQLPALTIAVTRDESPLLVTTNVEMAVDVYDAGSGRHLRTIGNFGQETPFLLHGAH